MASSPGPPISGTIGSSCDPGVSAGTIATASCSRRPSGLSGFSGTSTTPHLAAALHAWQLARRKLDGLRAGDTPCNVNPSNKHAQDTYFMMRRLAGRAAIQSFCEMREHQCG